VGLATGRLFLQWGLTVVLAAGLVRALKGPKALESLKDYQGAAFRFTKYVAPSEDWRKITVRDVGRHSLSMMALTFSTKGTSLPCHTTSRNHQ